jgi:hypothetical protein
LDQNQRTMGGEVGGVRERGLLRICSERLFDPLD